MSNQKHKISINHVSKNHCKDKHDEHNIWIMEIEKFISVTRLRFSYNQEQKFIVSYSNALSRKVNNKHKDYYTDQT
jgi:hypothetical protein